MHISEFARRLSGQVKTTAQATAVLRDYLAYFNIHSFAFTYYSGHIKSGRKLRFDCVSEMLRPWHLHYLEQHYADVDRTLEEYHTDLLPLFWDVQEQLKLAKNKRERSIRLESIEFGIDKGLSIPVYGPNHDFVSLTLHQRHNESCLKNYVEHQFEWQSATHLFYHTIRKILDLDYLPASPYRLTTREKQCITFTGKGWRVEKIAKTLGISSRTVNFHIQNANKKLGTRNKYQAAYKYEEGM